MADTARGDFGDKDCSDCGEVERGMVYVKHWGPLVPPGTVGYFGDNCWAARIKERDAGLEPRPLGTKPVSEGQLEFIEWGKESNTQIPPFGSLEFEERYKSWCSVGMLRDPVE